MIPTYGPDQIIIILCATIYLMILLYQLLLDWLGGCDGFIVLRSVNDKDKLSQELSHSNTILARDKDTN